MEIWENWHESRSHSEGLRPSMTHQMYRCWQFHNLLRNDPIDKISQPENPVIVPSPGPQRIVLVDCEIVLTAAVYFLDLDAARREKVDTARDRVTIRVITQLSPELAVGTLPPAVTKAVL